MNLGGKCYPSPSELEDAGLPKEEWPKELLDAAKWYWDRHTGVYSVNVTLFGILFIPLNPESALFKLNVT
jgi:hypothetical protein